MKIIDLPIELNLAILHAADLSPRALWQLGHQLTAAPNPLSQAARDDSLFLKWSSNDPVVSTSRTALNEAFTQRRRVDLPGSNCQLMALYRHYDRPTSNEAPPPPALGESAQGFDHALAALRCGIHLYRTTAPAVFYQKAILAHHLDVAELQTQWLPDTLIALINAAKHFGLAVPNRLISNETWKQFSPAAVLPKTAHGSYYEAAVTRWHGKDTTTRHLIRQVSDAKRTRTVITSGFNERVGDFDLMMALCAHEGSYLGQAEPHLLGEPALAQMAAKRPSGMWFSHLDATLQRDPALALRAVQSNAFFLDVVDPFLPNYIDIVRAACTQTGLAFRFASQGMRSNEDFVLELLHTPQAGDVFVGLDAFMMRRPAVLVAIGPYMQELAASTVWNTFRASMPALPIPDMLHLATEIPMVVTELLAFHFEREGPA